MPIQKRRPSDPFIVRMEAKRHSAWVSQLAKPITNLPERVETDTASWLSRVAGSWTLIRNFVLNAVGAIFFVVIAILLYDAVMRPTIAIGTISVPEDLQKKGYTSDVTADKLRVSINNLIKAAHSVKGSEELTRQAEIPDVVVPHTGLSVEAIAAQIRKTWGLRSRWQISGGITSEAERFELNIRAGNDEGSRVSIIRSQAKDFDQLMDNGAAEILRAADPYVLAVAYYRSDPGKGEELARQIIAEDTDPYWAHYFLGIIRAEQNKDNEAILHYRQAIALQPPETLSRRILAALASKLFGVGLDAKYGYAHYNLGIILKRQGKLNEAATEYNIAMSLNPGNPDAHCNLGGVLQDQGKLKEAMTEYQVAAMLAPKDPLPHDGIGYLLWKQGKLREASSEYKIAVELDPKDALPHYNLGFLSSQQGRFDNAISEYKAATALDPKDSRSHFSLGVVLSKQGKAGEAISEYKAAAALDPKDPRPHFNLGIILSNQGKLDEATSEYKTAIELNPKDELVHYNLGLVLYQLGKLDEAVAENKTAIALNPKSERLHYNLGLFLSRQGKPDDAVAEYKEAIKLDPKVSRPHYNLALILRSLGNLKEARAELGAAIKLDPLNPAYSRDFETSFGGVDKEERQPLTGARYKAMSN
jgi:tetratricopeptide (TPR) repeat protein